MSHAHAESVQDQALTPNDAPAAGFTERQWRNLLMDIEAGQVIPVIGPELVVVREVAGRPVTLATELATELATRLKLSVTPRSPHDALFAVSSAYLQDPRNLPEDLLYEARDIFTGRDWPVPEPLRQLAAIRHFDLYVSTTFDSLLQQALDTVRFGKTPGDRTVRTAVLAYSEKRQIEDLPSDPRDMTRPTVFQLFGRMDAVGDYALTEEKLLEFAHRFQSRDLRPQNLFDVMRAKSLLVLGCGFPGWLARFFLRAVKGDGLLTQGARGVVADATSSGDRDLVMFLQRRKATIYSDGDAVSFVAELFRRWTDRFGDLGAPEPARGAAPDLQLSELADDTVFLSYASEDRTVALSIKESFDREGIDTWFDQRALEGGDEYRAVIERNIERAAFFVPVLSRHTTGDDRRFFRLEWAKAIDEVRFRPPELPFILPVLADDTPPTAVGIPQAFRDRHCTAVAEVAKLAALIKRRIRERRLGRKIE